jgi:hypothetical protein
MLLVSTRLNNKSCALGKTQVVALSGATSQLL